jgi:hypothetical protein
MRQCSSLTKQGKPCSFKVEKWRTVDKCHIHDPNGVFRQQLKNGTSREKRKPTVGSCNHTWYMREPGIMCTKCGLIWEKGMDE